LNQWLRACFLSDPGHRIRFVYLPKHTSWLNQIECWFSILVRRLLRRGNFTSTDELKQQILKFIDYFNRALANPFLWKFKGFMTLYRLVSYSCQPALVDNKFDAMSDEELKRYFLEHRDDEVVHAYMDRCYARPNRKPPPILSGSSLLQCQHQKTVGRRN